MPPQMKETSMPQPSIQANASAAMSCSAWSLMARCKASEPPGCPPRLVLSRTELLQLPVVALFPSA